MGYKKVCLSDRNEMAQALLPLLEKNVPINLIVTGNSMYPLWVHTRDFVILEKVEPSKIRVGDVVLYTRDNGQFVLHRIYKIHNEFCDMIGDCQTEIEKNVLCKNIHAKVVKFVRKGKNYTVDDKLYKMYVFVWLRVRLLRKAFIKLIIFKNKVKKWIKNR